MVKENDQGSVKKARPVARGFEESRNTFEKESPTVSKDTLRTLLSTIISNNWNLKSIDIKTAFLQSENMICDVCLKPPPEVHCSTDQIWRLHKCVCELTFASLMWYKRIKKVCL